MNVRPTTWSTQQEKLMPIFTFTSEIDLSNISYSCDRVGAEVSCFGAKWNVMFCHQGNSKTQGSVGLFLQHHGRPIKIRFILKQDLATGFEKTSIRKGTMFSNNSGGFDLKLTLQEFLDKYEIIDKVTIVCTIIALDEGCFASELMAQETMSAFRNHAKQGRGTDFTLVVQGNRVPVHRWMLAGCSRVFTAMLSSGMNESTSNQAVISDFSVDAVRCFLAVVYMDEKVYREASMEVKLEVLRIADKYDVQGVITVMSDVVFHDTNWQNCLMVLDAAEQAHCTLLAKRVVKYIHDWAKCVWKVNSSSLVEVYGSQAVALMGYFAGIDYDP